VTDLGGVVTLRTSVGPQGQPQKLDRQLLSEPTLDTVALLLRVNQCPGQPLSYRLDSYSSQILRECCTHLVLVGKLIYYVVKY
jgi:hypothetical protein